MEQTKTNPLLERIRMPGEVYRLPSGGLFYAKDSGILDPGVTDGEVHVHPMTALDEIELKSPDLLLNGQAVVNVFQRCIPQVKDVARLLARDVDFLLTCLRKVSYGSDFEMEYKHTCDNAKVNTYTTSVDTFIKRTKRIDPTRVQTDFSLKLLNGQTVKFIPLSFGNFVELMQASDQDIGTDETAKRLFNSVSKLIQSVDEIDNKDNIVEWLSKVPPVIMKQLTEAIEKTTAWGPDFNIKLKCKDCNEEIEIQVPLNTLTFFT